MFWQRPHRQVALCFEWKQALFRLEAERGSTRSSVRQHDGHTTKAVLSLYDNCLQAMALLSSAPCITACGPQPTDHHKASGEHVLSRGHVPPMAVSRAKDLSQSNGK